MPPVHHSETFEQRRSPWTDEGVIFVNMLTESDSKTDVLPGTQRLRVSPLQPVPSRWAPGAQAPGMQAPRLGVAGGKFAVSRPWQAWAAAMSD
jgi:hypothetical protein